MKTILTGGVAALALALGSQALAQEAEADAEAQTEATEADDEASTEAEAAPAQQPRRELPRPRASLMDRAAQAGILTFDGAELAAVAVENEEIEAEASAPEARISREDALALATDAFDAADSDDDDALTEEEFVAAMSVAATGEGDAAAEPDADAAVEADVAEVGDVQEDLEALREQLATRFGDMAGEDGKLSSDEIEEAQAKAFDGADANDDDELVGEEAFAFERLAVVAPQL